MTKLTDLKSSTRPTKDLLPQSRRRIIVRSIGLAILALFVYSLYSSFNAANEEFEELMKEYENYETD